MTQTLHNFMSGLEPQLAEVGRRFDAELASDLPAVAALVRHVSRFRGKMLRPTLLLLTARAAGGVRDEHLTLATVVEMVHMATLVHDDVLDEAELRRRGATINHLRGNEAAVLLGDYLISHSYHLCSSLADSFAARAIAATTNRVCEGELLQLDNRGNLDLDESTYLTIIERKTASLIGTSCALGARYAGADEKVVEAMNQFGLLCGMAFQVQDDVLDLVGDSARVGKSLGGDIEKGKLTLPLIHFLRTAPAEHRQLLRTLIQSNDADRSEKVRNLIAPSRSIPFAQQRADEMVLQAVEKLAVLPDSDARQAMRLAAQFVTHRDR